MHFITKKIYLYNLVRINTDSRRAGFPNEKTNKFPNTKKITMKNLNSYFVLITILLSIIFTNSCKKDEENDSPNAPQTISIEGEQYDFANCYVEYFIEINGVYVFNVHLYEEGMNFEAETGTGRYFNAIIYTDSRIFEGGNFVISNTGNANTIGAAVFYDDYDFANPQNIGLYYTAYNGSMNIQMPDSDIDIDFDFDLIKSTDATEHGVSGNYNGPVLGIEDISWGSFNYNGSDYTFQKSKITKTENLYDGLTKYEVILCESNMNLNTNEGYGNYLVAYFYSSVATFNNTSFTYGNEIADGKFTLSLYNGYDLSDNSYSSRANVTSGTLNIIDLDTQLEISFNGMADDGNNNQYNMSGDYSGDVDIEIVDFSTIEKYVLYDNELFILENYSSIDAGNTYIVRMGSEGVTFPDGGETGSGTLIQFNVTPDGGLTGTYTISDSSEPGTSTCRFEPYYPNGIYLSGESGTLTYESGVYTFNITLSNGKAMVGKY